MVINIRKFKNLKVLIIGLLLLCTILLVIFCNKNSRILEPEKPHVFLIGLDGWGSYSFEDVRFNMPAVQELINSGSYTLEAMNVMPSISLPNWSSMLLGSSPDITGYKTNDPVDDGSFPSIFTLLTEKKPQYKAAFFYEWETMGVLCPDNVINKKQQADLSSDISQVISYIIDEKPNLAVIVIDQPDAVGHIFGHNTKEYYDELTRLDMFIAQIIQAIKDAGIWDNSVVILSSDHGGIGKGHGGDTPQERKIPFIITGNNIKKNNLISQAIMIYDITPIIAYVFELESPAIWEGKVIDVFKK